MKAKQVKSGAIRHDGQDIPYEITHRPRVTRRLHLELSEAGTLQVVAPRRMSRRSIRKSLQEHAPRVIRFLATARERQHEVPQLGYVSGESHLFMGQLHTLEVVDAASRRQAGVVLTGQALRVILQDAHPGRVKAKLTAWYRHQAEIHFADRLRHFAARAHWTGGNTPPMRLRLMKRTWGNCSVAGVITLNPHLVKAPPECIDYVIAHEICHLQEHNHGAGFYALQEQLYPAWREVRAWMRERGHVYLNA